MHPGTEASAPENHDPVSWGKVVDLLPDFADDSRGLETETSFTALNNAHRGENIL
jgi:hypothetical protein